MSEKCHHRLEMIRANFHLKGGMKEIAKTEKKAFIKVI
jgi:hypothetical protein